jgi:hypothetical protein
MPMIALRRWSALVVAFVLAIPVVAQEKTPSLWAVDRALTVAPQGAPVPALVYRLLPPSWDLKEGNAAPIYLRLAHAQSDEARNYYTETPKPWNQLPVDKVPVDEARKFLEGRRYLLRQLELGARRRGAEWNYTLDAGDPLNLLLPDLVWLRGYVPMLVLEARVALAERDFAAATHHLQTGLAFGRHVAEGPTLLHRMVAISMASQVTGVVADLIERPGAPNLYWALTALPRPLIPMGSGGDFEYRVLEDTFGDLKELDRERSPEQWEALLRRIRKTIQAVSMIGPNEGKTQTVPDWYPKAYGPEEPAAKSPDLPAAREFVARDRHLSAEQTAALPAAQVLVLYLVHTYDVYRDELFRGMYLPYPDARPLFESAEQRVNSPATSEGQVVARVLLPALDRATAAEMRLERTLAALRVIEALRMHAAAHDGRLPGQLSDVKEVPVPNDPGTGRAFEYRVEGDTATITSQVPDDSLSKNGIRYRVTLRSK